MEGITLTLSPESADELATLIAKKVAAELKQPEEERWLDAKETAEYLGMTPNALHKLTSSRAIPFRQDAPGHKLWFRRSELDRWRNGGGR